MVPKAQFVQQQSLLAETPIDAAQLETQIEILKSKAIATSVIKQLKLADDPDFRVNGPYSNRSGRLSGVGRQRARRSSGGRPDSPMDGLVAEFDDRLSAIRVGFSNV